MGVESVRATNGFGVTVSYWESEEDIRRWKHNAEYRIAQEKCRRIWYKDYRLKVAKVESADGMLVSQSLPKTLSSRAAIFPIDVEV